VYPLVDQTYDDSSGVGSGDADTLKIDAPLYRIMLMLLDIRTHLLLN